ncbi:MAG: DUF2066 domain-containing protein [Rhodospirillaceae bacterium]|nr:DUF2066 domain-containing protein [Rhodospirillaceae bacterium]
MLAWASLPSTAQAQFTIFTVTGVAVDVRARSTSDARTQALQSGQVEALDQLFRRLVPRVFYSDLPKLSARDSIDLVLDFSVANERSSSTRYLADLSVRFRPDAVRTALRFANIPFSETVSKPIVIVPVYQESIVADPILWQDPNPWRDAWYQVPDANSLVPRQLPYGDLEDLTTLRSNDAVAHDQSLLQQWAGRYGAADAVVASASPLGGIGAESVQVTLYFTRSGEERRIEMPAQDGQTWADLFLAAAVESWAEIEDEWKQENMLQFGMTGQITALVPLRSLEDWLTVKQRLQQVPLVDRFDLQAMTRDRAQVTVYYFGDENQLKLAMAQLDLVLVWQEEVWMIEDRRRESTQASSFGGAVSAASSQPAPSAYPPGLFQTDQTSDLSQP